MIEGILIVLLYMTVFTLLSKRAVEELRKLNDSMLKMWEEE